MEDQPPQHPQSPLHNDSSQTIITQQQQQQQQQMSAVEDHHQHNTNVNVDLIPDSLLALAKDSRYVQDCQSLVLHLLSSFFPRRRQLEQESWIVACLLCLALGMRQTAKATTLGMETVGLQFSGNAKHRWKFVLATISSLSWVYAFSPTTINNHSYGGGDAIATTSIQPSTSTNNTNNNNDEMLRGTSRRQFHEAQRQAMLRRANLAAAAAESATNNPMTAADIHQPVSTNSTITENNNHDSSTTITRARFLRRKVQTMIYQLAQILSSAVLAPLEGPHTLIHQQQHLQQQQQQSSIQTIGRWLAKLQLAHFCLTGRYPTWMHRLSGHSLMMNSTSSSNQTRGRLSHRPKTARLVGLLIGAQAMATLMQATSSHLSQWLLRRRLLVQQQQQQQQENSDAAPLGTTTPPVVFAQEASSSSTDNNNNNNKQEGASSICAICRTPRTHPAAPSSCGHVACWNCLMQWVSTIRPECPLCRAACRSQDIVALYHYDPDYRSTVANSSSS